MGLGCYGLEINPAGYAMSKFFSFANDSVSERETVADALETHICGLTDSLHDAPLFEPRESFRDSYANFLDFCSRLFARTEERKERLLAVNVLFLAEGCKSGTVGASVFSSFRQLKRILLELPFNGLPIHAGLGDARQLDRNCLKPADVILTSPPYINVFNYHQNYRAVLECLGWNLLKIAQSEFGSNRKNRGNRFRTVVQYCLDMEQAIMSFWRCLRDDGLMILVVGRESNVRRVPFYNGQMVTELIEALGAFAPVEKYERVFLNKFGNDIREDIIIVRKNRAEPTGQVARKIALRNLESALDRAEGEAAQDLRDAINEVESVEPSPIFSQEGVFSHAKYTA
jgi:hypothetical protein